MMQSVTLMVFLVSLLFTTSCATNSVKVPSESLPEIKPTHAEYQLLSENKLAQVWRGRCALGDPIGCVGFATWGSPKAVIKMHGRVRGTYWVGVGKAVRYNSSKGLLTGNPELYFSADALAAANLSLGKAIVKTHLGTTTTDLVGKHYFLSAREITKYHHAIFDRYNINRGWYGGSLLTGKHVPLLEPFYCRPSCDKDYSIFKRR